MISKIKKVGLWCSIRESVDLITSYKIEGAIVLWFIVFLYILISNSTLNLNLIGDAMGGIFGSFISTIVLIFVVRSYRLQKTELSETRKILEGQEVALKEQKIQSLIVELLKMSDKHLIDFEKFLIGIYTGWSASGLLKSYIANGDDLERHYQQGLLSPLISYFKTLKYIEELIINAYPNENSSIRENMISLVKNQINLDIINAYPKIKMHDQSFISFKYLFSGSAFPEIFPRA